MDNQLELHQDIVARIVLDGDLSKLNNAQLVAYYYHRCASLGIDPGEKPFDLLVLNKKKILYCTKAGAAALTRANQMSVDIKSKGWDGPMYVVEARASTPSGRFADDIGVIDMEAEHIEAKEKSERWGRRVEPISRANAMMKATTKAKRRAILACCGLGLLDETEVESIKGAQRVSFDQVEREAKALPTAETEPRCAGKAQPIADALRARRVEFANMVGDSPVKVWSAVLQRIGAEPETEPESLTIQLGKRAKETLDAWIAAKTPEPDAEPEDPTAQGAP